MPELPEVETVVNSLRPHIQGARFEGATILRQSTLHPLSLPLSNLTGLLISRVYRRAKLIMMDLTPAGQPETGNAPTLLALHLRMTGRVFTDQANRAQGKHTRCVFDLQNPAGEKFRLFFDDTRTFGKIIAATPQILSQWQYWRELGPEPLDLSPADFATRLTGRRPLKTTLLDQKVIAGIGNIYADEALFDSGLSPLRPANSLTPDERGKLLASIKKILSLAISQCGSSIRDYRDADGNAGAFQNSFLVYGRGGENCKKCGQELQKIKLGGRATVFCDHCQK